MNHSVRSIAACHPLFAAAAVFVLSACSGATDAKSTSNDTVATESSALESAQCSFKAYGVAADDCRATFESCVADGSDAATCGEQLKACLPPLPPGAPPPPGGPRPPHAGSPGPQPPLPGDGQPAGGGLPQNPVGDGAHPPLPPIGEGFGNGGAPLPPSDCDRPPLGPIAAGGGEGPRPGHPPIGPGPRPDRAALEACHAALETCLAGGGDRDVCFETGRACIRDAFAASFQTACDDATARCSSGALPAEVCTRIVERCAQGVAPAPDAPSPPHCQ